MPGRRQPSQHAKRPSVVEVLGNVLDELVTLKTKVTALEENAAEGESTQGVWPQPFNAPAIVNNSSPPPSTRQAPPVPPSVSDLLASGQTVPLTSLYMDAVAGGEYAQCVWQPLH